MEEKLSVENRVGGINNSSGENRVGREKLKIALARIEFSGSGWGFTLWDRLFWQTSGYGRANGVWDIHPFRLSQNVDAKAQKRTSSVPQLSVSRICGPSWRLKWITVCKKLSSHYDMTKDPIMIVSPVIMVHDALTPSGMKTCDELIIRSRISEKVHYVLQQLRAS